MAIALCILTEERNERKRSGQISVFRQNAWVAVDAVDLTDDDDDHHHHWEAKPYQTDDDGKTSVAKWQDKSSPICVFVCV